MRRAHTRSPLAASAEDAKLVDGRVQYELATPQALAEA